MSNSQSKNNSFERRLAGYALAAGTALVGAGQADANIIYSGPLNVNLQPLPTSGSSGNNVLPVDVDSDTKIDFALVNYLESNSDTPPVPVGLSIVGASAGLVLESVGGSPFATNLGYGDLISSSNVTSSPSKNLGKLTLDTIPSTGLSPSPWVPGVDAYIGFSFLIGTDTHYGWVETKIENDLSLTVKGWAYNDVASAGLDAGVVPEPSSLALLAAGAAGVVAFAARKRRVVVSAS